MNGETPSVPITTLAGVSSLTDLLPELPLPTPLPHTVNNRSLLFHPKISDGSRRVLRNRDENLASQIVAALRRTNTDHIELHDNLSSDPFDGEIPELLKAIYGLDKDVFKGGPSYNTADHGGVPLPQANQQPSPYQAGPSPGTPGSPARVPPVPGHSQAFHAGHNKYQQNFLNFAAPHGEPTVNGGSPSHYTGKGKSKMKPPNAPVSGHNNSNSSEAMGSHQAAEINGRKESSSDDAAGFDKFNLLQPQISLTRVEESIKKKKHKKLDDCYNVISATGSDTKLTLKLSKARGGGGSADRKGKKRRLSSEDEEDGEGDVSINMSDRASNRSTTPIKDMEIHGEFSMSLSERVKRRKKKPTYTELDDMELGNDNDEDSDPEFANFQSKRHKRNKKEDPDFMMEKGKKKGPLDDSDNDDSETEAPIMEMLKKKEKKRWVPDTNLSPEELMETPTFKRFSAAVDGVLESAEDVDLTELANIDDDESGGSDAIISRKVLVELCSEAAKLKAMGVMNKVPTEKLVKVLTILQFNLKDGCKHIPIIDEDDDERDDHIYKEITMEKLQSAVDAGLIALYIMTSPDMPKEVFIEDVIERLFRMTKTQLGSSIYPEFDPVYKIDPKNKSGFQSHMKQKRARASIVRNKGTLLMYNKLTEVIACMSELIDVQELTDTIVLQASTLAVSPFFVENINELQLSSLKLVTSLFSKYDKHRQLILEDILASLARLPTSKKNLRSYRLNSDEHIQMVTALVLELIQCVVRLPPPDEPLKMNEEKVEKDTLDKEVTLVTSYETAMRTAHNFLSVFLKKCTTKGEEDYRPLFENFVYDLLATVNKPEWPAAELLLSLLGRLLVHQFSNKSLDMSLRLASMDYLGIVAARLRKDAVTSVLNEEIIDEIINQINESDDEDVKKEEPEEKETRSNKKKKEPVKKKPEKKPDRIHNLQKALLEYLVYNSDTDAALIFARQFYIGQWYRDCTMEVEKAAKEMEKCKDSKDKKKSEDEESEEEESEEESESDGEDNPRARRARARKKEEKEKAKKDKKKQAERTDELAELLDKTREIQELSEGRKAFLMDQLNMRVGAFANFKPSPSKLDYDKACLVTRYLASGRPFSQSFDIYLSQILKVLCETAVAVRTRAMKCLSAVVEADPGILGRSDMQRGVHCRFLDQSTSVREAAVELVGKFILIRPELTTQYYGMLSDRILDTGISVRKRTIKIFRDICIEQTEFDKIPEMCVKMIRRVNDEEGIRKLVNDTFQNMWFLPLSERESAKLLTKVMNITDVVLACRDTGYDWFEHLLENLLKKEEDASHKPVETACEQVIRCLVENVLALEEKVADSAADGGKGTCTPRIVGCFQTLHLFCKVKPMLLVPHTQTVQPYLNIKCLTQADSLVLHNVAKILELSVPLMEHPSESFLVQLEEDMMKLILRQGMTVLQSCVSCLGAVVNNVTKNYKLVRDTFQKFFGVLSKLMNEHKQNPQSPGLLASKPTLLRSLFTVGLLCRHFNFDSEDFGERKVSIKNRVFEVLLYFVLNHEEEIVQLKALAGIGFLVTQHYEFMLERELRDVYALYLKGHDAPVRMKCQVLRNINTYLTEEENRMMHAEEEWRKKHDKEDLKEMGDVQSGMASTIIQVYLKHLLESFFNHDNQVRLNALNVIVLVLGQGLVHPVQIVPYLISMGSDCDSIIRSKADQQLQEIDKKYPGFIQMKALHGVKMAYTLQKTLQEGSNEVIRGMREESDQIVALSSFIYSLIRSNRNQRRALISSTLNNFDDSGKAELSELIFLADNLAFFPYQVQDEPLYIIHQIDIIVSVCGSNLIQSFREIFFPGCVDAETGKLKIDEDDEEDVDLLLEKMPEDVSGLQKLYLISQGCMLLLNLKQHLKDMYGATDAKLQRYSPTEQAKVWDRPLNRKQGVKFYPKQTIDLVQSLPLSPDLDQEGRKQLLEDYLDFKQLMLSIDPDEEDDEDDYPGKPVKKTENKEGEEAKPAENAEQQQNGEGGQPATEGGAENPVNIDDEDEEEPVKRKDNEPALYPSRKLHKQSRQYVSDRKRNRPSRSSSRHHHSSSSRSHHHHSSSHHSSSRSSHKHKKKKRKSRRMSTTSEEESEENSGSDSDWE